MGCCQRCCTNTCLTFFTLFTLGATLGFLIFSTYIVSKVRKVNDTIFIILVVATCITGIVFIFGIYASCCGNRCARGALSVIYLAYALAILACGIIVLIYRNKFANYLRDNYYDEKLTDSDKDYIEKTFDCTFPERPVPNATNATLLENSTASCFDKFDDFCKKFGIIIGVVLIFLFVVIFIGVVFACNAACKKRETSSGSKTKEQVSTPLTYGW